MAGFRISDAWSGSKHFWIYLSNPLVMYFRFNRGNLVNRSCFGALYFWSLWALNFGNNKTWILLLWSFQISRILNSDQEALLCHQQALAIRSQKSNLVSGSWIFEDSEESEMGNCQNWFWKLSGFYRCGKKCQIRLISKNYTRFFLT